MRQQPRNIRGSVAAAALLTALSAPVEALRIEGTATDYGSYFSYELYVVDNVLPNLVVVSLLNAPLGDTLIGPSLTAPVGYLASYDSGLGIVDFLTDTTLEFGLPTTGPFTFASLFGPASYFAQSRGLDDNLNEVSMDLATITVVQGPNGQVSGPGGIALLGLGLALLAGRRGWALAQRHNNEGGNHHEP